MAEDTPEKKADPNQPPVPPDERFWKRYSPHHEFPLSTVGSIVVHALLIVALVVIAVTWQEGLSAAKPVEMKVVEIEGGGGLGLDDMGSGTTLLGGKKGAR